MTKIKRTARKVTKRKGLKTPARSTRRSEKLQPQTAGSPLVPEIVTLPGGATAELRHENDGPARPPAIDDLPEVARIPRYCHFRTPEGDTVTLTQGSGETAAQFYARCDAAERDLGFKPMGNPLAPVPVTRETPPPLPIEAAGAKPVDDQSGPTRLFRWRAGSGEVKTLEIARDHPGEDWEAFMLRSNRIAYEHGWPGLGALPADEVRPTRHEERERYTPAAEAELLRQAQLEQLGMGDKPFEAQPHTFLGVRGLTMVSLSVRDLYKIARACIERMGDRPDIDAVCQNICVDIEKKMGIFPNVPKLENVPVEKRMPAPTFVAGEISPNFALRDELRNKAWDPAGVTLMKDQPSVSVSKREMWTFGIIAVATIVALVWAWWPS